VLAAQRSYRYDPFTALKLLSIERLPNRGIYLHSLIVTTVSNGLQWTWSLTIVSNVFYLKKIKYPKTDTF
jgi:hypothetical protein